MGKYRGKSVWVPGKGWVAKKITQDANYQNLGEGWIFLISFMRAYPDFIQDLFHSEEADNDLALIQRVIMRAKARNQFCDITGSRGTTKTYSTDIEELDELLLYPGIHESYFGPSLKQTAKIGSKAYAQIKKDYPGLTEHFITVADSVDRFELSTSFGSTFEIASFRGNNLHRVVAEETAQEEMPKFNAEDYENVVLPAVRLKYLVDGKPDKTYIPFKRHTITSAGRRQNPAYKTRCDHFKVMSEGGSAVVFDIPFEVSLLCKIRDTAWAESLKLDLTPDKWAREMESRYTGADENPIISDATLTESRSLIAMEEHHCCKDFDNRLNPEEVFYIVAYDVSYADGAANAKCACAVIKCTKQSEWLRRDKYLKQVVWIDDWLPKPAAEQAVKLKQVWSRFSYEGHYAYIAIDAWQYGSAVLQELMKDLGDGLPPLCTMDHTTYTEYEIPESLPVVYPIKAGGAGTTDPDSEMVRNAEVQFENHNVQLLTSNYSEGIETYKRKHRIKDDTYDRLIYKPYKKTNDLIGQIQNLKKVENASGVGEKRISSRIQRDSWSALKYGLRLANILERRYLQRSKRPSDWDKELEKYKKSAPIMNGFERNTVTSRLVTRRMGGRQFEKI